MTSTLYEPQFHEDLDQFRDSRKAKMLGRLDMSQGRRLLVKQQSSDFVQTWSGTINLGMFCRRVSLVCSDSFAELSGMTDPSTTIANVAVSPS